MDEIECAARRAVAYRQPEVIGWPGAYVTIVSTEAGHRSRLDYRLAGG